MHKRSEAKHFLGALLLLSWRPFERARAVALTIISLWISPDCVDPIAGIDEALQDERGLVQRRVAELARRVDVRSGPAQLLLDWVDSKSGAGISQEDIVELFSADFRELIFIPLGEAEEALREDAAEGHNEEAEYQRRFADATKAGAIVVASDEEFDPELGAGREIRRVEVFFGTNRADGGLDNVRARHFANAQGVELRVGVAQVTLPPDHEQGRIERPWSILVRFDEDQRFHIVVESADLLSQEDWLKAARDKMEAEQEAFLFVHGFNVTFDEAMRRTAQLANDLKLCSMPLCFSWASAASLTQYTHDEDTIEWSKPHLKEFVELVMDRMGLRTLHIVAHSMGNRAVLEVLREICRDREHVAPIDTVVLAAPDVHTPIFRQRAADFGRFRCVTMYASRFDWAIRASDLFHRGQRAGDGSPPLVLQHLDTIDVSDVSRGGVFDLGHGYIASAAKVFRDLYEVLRYKTPIARRMGVHLHNEGGYYELR